MTGRRDGFVLAAALWFVVALSALALDMSLQAKERRLVAANRLEGAKARAAADAGIEETRWHLAALLGTGTAAAFDMSDPWAAFTMSRPDTIAIDDTHARLQLEDAAARLHLNLADEEQLRRFFRALGVDWGEADRVAQAIADWRDADDLHRARGAEREEYLRATSLVLPRNAPFRTIFELRDVRGITPEVFDRAVPFLTLHGTGQININTATEPVLLSLPGVTPAAVAVIESRRRARRPIRLVQELADALPPTARQSFLAESGDFVRLAAFETREVRVVSTGWVEGSPVRAQVTAVFARAGGTAYLVWRSAR